MLRENRELMDKLAAFLIERETITGKEFMEIFAKHLQCLIVALLDHGNDFFVNGCCRFITTVQRGSSLQILALASREQRTDG